MQESKQTVHIFSYWSAPFDLVLTEHMGCIYTSFAISWIHQSENIWCQPTLYLCQPQDHWVSNSGTARARTALAQPHCGLTTGGRSHFKEGKQWKNRQKELHLLEDLKMWIFSEKHCTLTPILLPKSNNWTLFTDVALGLMFCCFCSCHTV